MTEAKRAKGTVHLTVASARPPLCKLPVETGKRLLTLDPKLCTCVDCLREAAMRWRSCQNQLLRFQSGNQIESDYLSAKDEEILDLLAEIASLKEANGGNQE